MTCNNSITVVQNNRPIQVCCQNPLPSFVPFFLTATIDGQLSFALPVPAVISIWVYINGVGQSGVKTPTPDFTVNGNILTFSSGLDEGDNAFGMIQVG